MNLAGLVLNLSRIMDILSLAKITIDNCISVAYRTKNSLSKFLLGFLVCRTAFTFLEIRHFLSSFIAWIIQNAKAQLRPC